MSYEGDADGADPQFGPAQKRKFSPRSESLGSVLNLGPRWQLSSNWSYTERAPTSYEWYANGVHAAASAYERGDPRQGLERGRNLDGAGLEGRRQPVKIGVFESRFANYIALQATGEPDFIHDEGGSFPVFAFRGVRARLYGLEVEGAWRAIDGERRLDVDAKLDIVRGRNTDSGEALPRLAPRRATVGLTLGQGAWTARAEVQQASAQQRVPGTDAATAGWTLVNLSASYALHIARRDALLFVKLQNAGNKLAYSASSIGTVRALSPWPGRGFFAGLRFSF